MSRLSREDMPLVALKGGVIGFLRVFVALGEDAGRGLGCGRWIMFELHVNTGYVDLIGRPVLFAV
ncbi:MAG: hypothetical protein R3F46_04345 [bacterium]